MHFHLSGIGIILIVIGLAAMILRNIFARDAMGFQNRNFGFRFGKFETTFTAWGYFVVGLIFVIVGILTLLGKVHWK